MTFLISYAVILFNIKIPKIILSIVAAQPADAEVVLSVQLSTTLGFRIQVK